MRKNGSGYPYRSGPAAIAAPPRRKRTLAGAEHEWCRRPAVRGRRRTACCSAGARWAARGRGYYIHTGRAQAGARVQGFGSAPQRNSGGVAFGGASPLCDGVKYKQGKVAARVRHEGDGNPRAARPCELRWLGSRSGLAVAEPGDDGWLGGWCAVRGCGLQE